MKGKKRKLYGGKQNKRVVWVLLIVACVVVLSFAAVTGAKYVLQWSKGVAQADAKAFYFTSDLLTEGDTPQYQLANFVPGTSTIDFTLRNYTDELRVSEADIVYTVSATGLSNTSGTIVQNGSTGVNQSVSLTVPASAFTNGKATIRVTASAASPYAKTLSAVFELYQKIDSVSYSVYDASGSNTVTLTVTTDDKAGTVNIAYPSGALPDRTDSRLSFGTGTCSFNAEANAQYSFVFFKTSPSEAFSTSDFAVN